MSDGWPSALTAQLTAAICAQIVATGQPYTVADARLQRPPKAAESSELIAHAGAPLIVESGVIVGAVCVADDAARQWTEVDSELLAVQLCSRAAAWTHR